MDALVEACHRLGSIINLTPDFKRDFYFVIPLVISNMGQITCLDVPSDHCCQTSEERPGSPEEGLQVFHNVGVKEEGGGHPTYVYPEQVKTFIRSVFPEDIRDYPDPCHPQVVYITMEDLHKLN